MQEFIRESKRIIKRAIINHNLIIFVGSGVSLNSGYLSWENFIKKFADGIGLKSYSIDEYLKIPQYYYDMRNEKEYYDIITDALNIQSSPEINPIDDLIVKNFNLDKIITTNYDELLEKSALKLGINYDVVAKDMDFPNNQSNRMIIKMHGDFKNKNIVLKEEDYLNYSEKFRLIETYVKALIATNLVLFVGYSLSDPDVKRIFTWVKNILKEEFRKIYFLDVDIDDKGAEIYKNRKIEFDYYKHMGINMLYYTEAMKLGDKEFPMNLVPADLNNEVGIALYRFLYYLSMNDNENSNQVQNGVQLNEINNIVLEKNNKSDNEVSVNKEIVNEVSINKEIVDKKSINEVNRNEEDIKIKSNPVLDSSTGLPNANNIRVNLVDNIKTYENSQIGNFIGISYIKYIPTNDSKKPWNKIEGVVNGQIIANNNTSIKVKYCNEYKEKNPVYVETEFYNLLHYGTVIDRDKRREEMHNFYFDHRIRSEKKSVFWLVIKIYDKNYPNGHTAVYNGFFDSIMINEKGQNYISDIQLAMKYFEKQPERVIGIGYYIYDQVRVGNSNYTLKYLDKFIGIKPKKTELINFGLI